MKTMKTIGLLLLSAALVLTAAACGAGTGSEDAKTRDGVLKKSITMKSGAMEGSLDPAGVAISSYVEYAKLCIDPLVSFDGQGTLIYEAAESHTVNEDQTVWTFRLRADGKWSDGSPVVAADFVNTIRRCLAPDGQSIYADQLYVIRGAQEAHEDPALLDGIGVSAPDEYTLEFTLKQPCTYFLKLLTLPVFAPSKEGLAVNSDPAWYTNPATSLGNGAFYMTEYVQDERYVLAKNPYYHSADRVKIDEVVVRTITDSTAAVAAYKSGEVDVASGLPAYILDEYEGKEDLYIWNMQTTKFILPNLNVAPLDDVRVRRAIALGIDRSSACAAVGSDYIPTTSFVAKSMISNASDKPFSEEKAPLFTEDVELARQLLAEAGYPGGEGFPTLTYNYPNTETDSDLAQAIQAQLKDNLGINLELNGMEMQVFSSERRAGNFTLSRHSWTADYTDPVNYLSLYTSYSGNNDNGVNDAEFDRLVEASNLAMDPAARNELLHEAEARLVADQFYVIPVNTQIYVGLRNPKITGVTTNDRGEGMYRFADLLP
ncbi:MAG: peptide ABC transporter substrate-binding protein [Oscillospiraceae bacterium]|jgi:oligopeptide transport system substrate-binding protein|nr:peptide ABC transporter substrate-binding protein [Oscillospiraceae bacterium]